MKIVMINGQNHKGSTYHIGKMLIDEISEPKEVKEFFLPRDLNHFCLGCYACIEDETKCPFYDEKLAIMSEVEKADVLVFTTPNYCMAPSAPLKAFIDLTFSFWFSHKPKACMFHKRAVIISTTAGAGTGMAMKPVARTMSYWGVSCVKKYGMAVQAMNWEGVSEKKKVKIKKDIHKLASKLSTKKKVRTSIKIKLMFKMFAKIQKAGWGSSETEKKYWEDKGWLGKVRPWK